MRNDKTGSQSWLLTGNNLTGVVVQFATQHQKNAIPVQKCTAVFNIKICYYVVLFIPISSKLNFFAMRNSESIKIVPWLLMFGHPSGLAIGLHADIYRVPAASWH